MRTYFASGGVSIEEHGVTQVLKLSRSKARWAAIELRNFARRAVSGPTSRCWRFAPGCIIEAEITGRSSRVVLTVNDWERYYPRPEEFHQFLDVLRLYGAGKDRHL